jgi:hypothetical protein
MAPESRMSASLRRPLAATTRQDDVLEPFILGVAPRIEGDMVVVRAVFASPARDVGRTWTLQLYFDVDSDIETGSYPGTQGCEYVGRVLEIQSDGRFPIRLGVGTPDPDPRSGGWGVVSGFADLDPYQPNALVMRVPLAALGGDDGRMGIGVETFTARGATTVDQWRGQTHFAAPGPITRPLPVALR